MENWGGVNFTELYWNTDKSIFLAMLAAFNPDGKISLSISVDILRRRSSSPEDKFHDLGDPPTSL